MLIVYLFCCNFFSTLPSNSLTSNSQSVECFDLKPYWLPYWFDLVRKSKTCLLDYVSYNLEIVIKSDMGL